MKNETARANPFTAGSPAASSKHAWPQHKGICLAVMTSLSLLASQAYANCTTDASNNTTCDTTSTYTSTIGTGKTDAGATVTVQSNAQVVVGNAPTISLGDNANITLQSGALVQNAATSGGGGGYGFGKNTIEFNNNSTLTVAQGATVLSSGTAGDAEAVNPIGISNTIINNGTIRAINNAAIWLQASSGLNTVINKPTGVIETDKNGGNSNVLGASGNGAVDFTNKGQVNGNLQFFNGDDTLRLNTGSTITGSIAGGGGNNLLTLNGTGTDTLPSPISGFQTLQKQDSGTWIIANSLSTNLSGLTSAEVQGGTLILAADTSNYTGSMTVDNGGTLQLGNGGTAGSINTAITDNGTVAFDRSDVVTYAKVISGSGSVAQIGSGTTTLTGVNTYAGGTFINNGTLAVGADSALGNASGGITFNGGMLQLAQSFDPASTRAVTLNAPGGTIDTQSFNSTFAQGITGAGALTKAGSGTLVLAGDSSYGGGTTIAAGTLQLGNGGHQRFDYRQCHRQRHARIRSFGYL